ncbi:hypothetical protein DMJ13_26740 [halophilic archaeon]|nr:hypothetical protein DMJ13_26740 [halophilic archaeon]
MSFETISLRLEKADVHRIITEDVEGLRSKRVDDSIEYRGNDGMLLAVLSDIDSNDGAESTLRYQTSILTPPLAHGRTKAREIRDAVAEYRKSR